MKNFALVLLFSVAALAASAQKKANNTLLWKITGNGLTKPSYLFGTMHMLCGDDIELSDSLVKAISKADNIYLEVDMNNMAEMMGAMAKMKMRGDTTLSDLLTEQEFETVKAYFKEKKTIIPFSLLQSYKPFLAASMVMSGGSKGCDQMISMEQLIMSEAREAGVKIKGLETMNYQMSLFDSIPYKIQAQQLYDMIKGDGKDNGGTIKELTRAYKLQELEKMESMIIDEDMGIRNYTELLLYARNDNWAKKLGELMPGKSLVIAVGAGHLPGQRGVIQLLKKAGYQVTPVANNMIRKKA